jgi:hypothetical protein
MNDERSEHRLREWFVSAPTIAEPPSIHEYLAAVPILHPSPARTSAWTGRTRVVFLAAAIALVAIAAIFAVVGSHLLDRTPAPTGMPTSPNPSLSSSLIGSATRIGQWAGKSASFAATTDGPVVVIPAGVPGSAAGAAPCPQSTIGSIGATSIDWNLAPGAILELAGDRSASPVGLGVSSDCSQATVALPAGSGRFDIRPAPNLFPRYTPFFARKPGDPSTLAAWVADPLKGGFLSWSTDGGATWQSRTNARPIGWDAAGNFWTIGPHGAVARSRGPGFSSTIQSGVAFDLGAPVGSIAADIAAAAVFRDRILVAPPVGGLQSGATAGSTSPERSLDLQIWDISAGNLYVAAVGLDGATGRAELAISADGRTFTLSPLPSAFATGRGAPVRLLALDDRVLLSDGGENGLIGIWSIPVAGLPPPPPVATPAPTPALPSSPPAEKTSTWTPVAFPSLPHSPDFGGPAGGISALPGGGFIDFVRMAVDQAAVVTSADGTTWTQTGKVSGLGLANIAGPVAFDGKRYVALGGEGGGQYYGMQLNGAAWVSTDLAHWTKAPAQEAFAGAEFNGLAAGPNGFVAVGYDASGSSVWTSPDGLHWAVVGNDPALPRDSAWPSNIVHTQRGFLMIGRIDQKAAAWTSTDGRTWTVHAPLVVGSDALPGGLATGADGYVTLASGPPTAEVTPGDFRSPVAPWISSDGIIWRPEPASPALFGANAAIVAAPGGFVAAGTVGLDPDARVWTSTNGVEWVPVAGVDLRGVGSVELVSDGRHVILAAGGDNGSVTFVSRGVDR